MPTGPHYWVVLMFGLSACSAIRGWSGDAPITCDLFASCVLPAVQALAACVPQGPGAFSAERNECVFDDGTTVTLDPPFSVVWGLLPGDIHVRRPGGEEGCFLVYTGPAVQPPAPKTGFATYRLYDEDGNLVVETKEEAGELRVVCDGTTHRGSQLPDAAECPEAALFEFPSGGGQILNSTVRFLLRAEAGVFFACKQSG